MKRFPWSLVSGNIFEEFGKQISFDDFPFHLIQLFYPQAQSISCQTFVYLESFDDPSYHALSKLTNESLDKTFVE